MIWHPFFQFTSGSQTPPTPPATVSQPGGAGWGLGRGIYYWQKAEREERSEREHQESIRQAKEQSLRDEVERQKDVEVRTALLNAGREILLGAAETREREIRKAVLEHKARLRLIEMDQDDFNNRILILLLDS